MDAELVSRVANRYRRTASRMYAKGKLSSDPIAGQLVALGREQPLGHVVDVGCGRGQMAVLLCESGVAERVSGFDWDAKKVEEGNAAAEGLRAHFSQGDVRTEPIPEADTVLLVDVLHYLTDKQQEDLVARVIASARRAVVVRELDPDRGWRSATTKLQEGITTLLGYNVGERVRVRPIADVVGSLEAAGFTVRVEPSWGSTPFANVAIIATRPHPPAPSP